MTHQVTLNGKAIAMARDHFKLLTMVRSTEHHDGDGKRFAVHEIVMEGVDTVGAKVTQFISPTPLKKGDIVQIVIGETHDA